MDSKSHKKQNKVGHPWSPKLAKFYNFIEASRNFLEMGSYQNADMDLISQLREMMEISKESHGGTVYKESKFDSAIYRDIDRIALLRVFLQRFTLDDLKYFQKLVDLEIQGLEGDLKPHTMLTSTIPAAIITGLSLVAVWSAFWSTYFGFDVSKIFVEVFMDKITKNTWLNGILSLIFVIGGFVGISWYVIASYQNLNQISHLRSLHRAITLYLSLEESTTEA